VKRGQTLRLAANVLNLGDVEAGPFVVEFSYRYAPQITPPVTPSGIVTEPVPSIRFAAGPVTRLGVGKGARVQALLETIDLRPGMYSIRAEIDPILPGAQGAVREENETNNVFETQVLIQGPDLTLSGLELSPLSPVARGDVLTLKATALNVGVEAAGRFSVGFSWCRIVNPTGLAPEFQCTEIGSVSFTGIAVGSPILAEGRFDTSALEPGEYVLRATVDSLGEVAEQDEMNNEILVPLTIGGTPSGADLAATNLVVNSGWSTSSARSTVKITNLGTADAQSFSVQFSYAPVVKLGTGPTPTVFFTTQVASLAHGATTTIQALLRKSPLAAGTYRITALVDAGGAIREKDEENNSISALMTLP